MEETQGMMLDGPYFDLIGGYVYVNGIPHDIESFNKLAKHFRLYPVYNENGNLIHNEINALFKARHVSTTRNMVLGELYDTRNYLLPSGRRVAVRTICEFDLRKPKGKV